MDPFSTALTAAGSLFGGGGGGGLFGGGGSPPATGTFSQGGLSVGNYQSGPDQPPGLALDQTSMLALAGVAGLVMIALIKKG